MMPSITKADMDTIDAAIRQINQGAMAQALPTLLAMRERYPHQFFLEGIIAKAYYAQKELPSASFHFRKVLEHNPSSELASYGLFVCLWQMGEKVDALKEMDRYLSTWAPELYVTILDEVEDHELPDNPSYRDMIRRLRERHHGLLKK
jgi:predicted Zn-dependent protease